MALEGKKMGASANIVTVANWGDAKFEVSVENQSDACLENHGECPSL